MQETLASRFQVVDFKGMKDQVYKSPLAAMLKLTSLLTNPIKVAVAEKRGVSLNELKTLMCIAGEQPIAGYEISRIMGLPAMNVSRALSSLEAMGWAEVAPNPKTARHKPYQLTEVGHAANDAIAADLDAFAAKLLNGLSTAEIEALGRAFDHMLQRVETEQTHK